MSRKDDRFRQRYGPWALVAGASEGLGAEFARQIAARGVHLVLVARRPEPLADRARALSAEFGVEAVPVSLDLSASDVWERLAPALADRDVGLLVYNAAASLIGPFLDQALADQLRIVATNCRTPLVLTHELGRRMAARRRGGIVLVTSMAGRQGAPHVVAYGASKAFQLVLGEGLWEELGAHGVDVLAACAGATRTPAYLATNPDEAGLFKPKAMPVEPVVAEALAALGRTPSTVTGRFNRFAAFVLGRVLPRSAAVRAMGRGARALYDR